VEWFQLARIGTGGGSCWSISGSTEFVVCLFVCELITSCSSNGISYTYFLIVKGYFKILCWTNTAPMHSLEH
jgi:hypothetical protein